MIEPANGTGSGFGPTFRIRWDFIMGLFFSDEVLKADELLADESIRELLATLYLEVPFFSVGQAHQFLSHLLPKTVSAHRAHKVVRTVLDVLQDAGLLGSEKVSLLPDVTVGQQPIIKSFPPPHDPDNAFRASPQKLPPCRIYSSSQGEEVFTLKHARSVATIARERVPALDLHRPTRLFFAQNVVRDHLIAFGGYGNYTFDPGEGNRPTDNFMRMLSWHLAVENQRNPSPYDIAGTALTAVYNINQLRFMDRYQVKNRHRWGCMLARKATDPPHRPENGNSIELLVFAPMTLDIRPVGSLIGTNGNSGLLWFVPPVDEHRLYDLVLEAYRTQVQAAACWWM